jgi:hypothetical protein
MQCNVNEVHLHLHEKAIVLDVGHNLTVRMHALIQPSHLHIP